MVHVWKWRRVGNRAQVRLESGADIAALRELDGKRWSAISCPVKGLRFDARTLELLDADGDGRVRTPEVLAAIDFLQSKGVNFDDLLAPSADDEARLADVMSRQADLAKVEVSEADRQALADWEAKGVAADVAVLGEGTAAAEAALSAVEATIDTFFTPPEDLPLVTEAPDPVLPLGSRINPRHQESVQAFAAACVRPLLGEKGELSRQDWKRVKASFAAYRAWKAAKPVVNAGAMAALVEEERLLRYRLHLFEFLENFVNMRRLYDRDELAVFQTGRLRIDGRELDLCFHVDSEAAHAALADKSKCCVLYLKLTRPGEKCEGSVCAVVTAGTVGGLYVGRNGVFYDRDGKDWEAVVTKVVESQVSLLEAFWAPWRKIGEGIAAAVKKFLGDKQASATAKVTAGTQNAQAGGAALASSVAAIGIGIGMVGAAFASIMAAVAQLTGLQLALSVIAMILVVSLPSVILTWFKLRRRDLGAILNASGWAVNGELRFSMSLAREFTRLG